jgi:hypothetical protein
MRCVPDVLEDTRIDIAQVNKAGCKHVASTGGRRDKKDRE